MLIKNGKVLLFEENGFVKRDLRVKDGKIQEIGEGLSPEQGEELLDAEGKYVTPGLIDAHSHLRQRGGHGSHRRRLQRLQRRPDALSGHAGRHQSL